MMEGRRTLTTIGGLAVGLAVLAFSGVVLLAVIIHNIPDSISIPSILLSAGWSRPRVAVLSLLFSLTTPAGADADA